MNESSILLTCQDSNNEECALTCVGLEECQKCECAVVDTHTGPWGGAMDVIMCLLPIAFLLAVTLKPKPLPTTQSLPMAALLMFLIRLMYLGSDPILTAGSVISGLHEALSPLTIMFGAILLFETMEATLCMPFMMREMKGLTKGHAVAELMLLFAFAYMVEGASGFGTPVALGAPMLVSLGYPKFESVVTLLLMNTFATVWGAAGTPIWFGFGSLDLTEDDFVDIANKGAVALVIAAILLLPTLVLTKVCPRKTLQQNAPFLALSMMSVLLPTLGLSFVSYEFPSLLGGMVGCILTAILIQFRVGMKDIPHEEDETGRHHPMGIGTTSDDHSILTDQRSHKNAKATQDSTKQHDVEEGQGSVLNKEISSISNVSLSRRDVTASGDGDDDSNVQSQQFKPALEVTEEMDNATVDELPASHAAIETFLGPRKQIGEGYIKEVFGRTFPLWGTVLLLIVTRVPQIGIKQQLTRLEPNFSIHFGTYGTFKLSASLVLQLQNILNYPNLNWKYELLYIPFLVPFGLVSLVTMLLYRRDLQSSPTAILKTVTGRLAKPAIALMGALVLVQLIINEGPSSPAEIIGEVLSGALQGGWVAFVPFVGALGSFFSGSTTISNLTFGNIHFIAAKSIGTSTTGLLALQAAGASAGNGICLNNIISACAVVGLNIGEGKIIAKTFIPVFCFCLIAMVVMLAFFLRF
mmetsp:Transcript_16708/g.24210  ORF Transcript_16708/g.24210 Transcript_16708/m.24210 type:complete len:695 (+) Transcript_16708:30-2114(+)